MAMTPARCTRSVHPAVDHVAQFQQNPRTCDEVATRFQSFAFKASQTPRRPPYPEEELLWETPENLSVRKMEGEETADRWLTGIVEVQLPMDYKLKNIEETELAKAKMLEKTRRRGGGAGQYHRPEGGGSALYPGMSAPAPLPKRQQQPANLSANFSLHRKMFARSFGQGRGATTTMQEYVGAPKAQKAENVASDDYVFKRYVNNERKKKQRK